MKPTNLPLAIVSVLLSAFLWLILYPQTVDEVPSNVQLRLNFQRLPGTYVLTGFEPSVYATAKATKDKLTAIEAKVMDKVNPGIQGIVDLKDVKPGRNRLPVIIYPPEFKDSFPDRIFTVVYIEPLSTRKVPVEVETQGQMEDPTLALEDTVADPSVVSVSGPASAVADVSKVRVYLDLRLISLTQRDAQLLSVEPVTERGVVPPGVSADPKVVRVTPLISSSPQQKQVGIVAQLTGSPPQGYIMAGYEVKPPLVSLRGSSRALAAITQLATESIDLSKLTHNLDVAVDLRVPQGVAIVGSKRVQVRVMVNRVSSNAP